MASYVRLTTVRVTAPDPVALRAAVQAATGDPTAVVFNLGEGWQGKKTDPWSAADIAATQSALDAAPEWTPQRAAQTVIDNMPILEKAIILTLLDETNRLRAALRGLGVTGLPNIDVPTMIGAVRTKAGSL